MGLRVRGRRNKGDPVKGKPLELKITVAPRSAATDPDKALALTAVSDLSLDGTTYRFKVTKIERADGQPFGAESEFEDWWRDGHAEGEGEEETHEKMWAREAFNYAVTYMRRMNRA